MKFSTSEEMKEWYRQEIGKEPSAKCTEMAKYFVWLCEGLEELGKADAAGGRKPISSSLFRKLMEDTIIGESDIANHARSEWADTAQECYMRGYIGSNR